MLNIHQVNGLKNYFYSIIKANRNLLMLASTNPMNVVVPFETYLYNVVTEIPRLIPMKKLNSGQIQIIDDGILKLKIMNSQMSNLFEKLLTEKYDIIESVLEFRNKYQHIPHLIKINSISDMTQNFATFGYDINGREKSIRIDDIIILMKEINSIYMTIFDALEEYKQESSTNSLYIEKITMIRFSNFNKIFDLPIPIVKIIGLSFIE